MLSTVGEPPVGEVDRPTLDVEPEEGLCCTLPRRTEADLERLNAPEGSLTLCFTLLC